MNQAIVDYLTQNKDQYSQEALLAQLQKSGYPQADITEAVATVYGSSDDAVQGGSQSKTSKEAVQEGACKTKEYINHATRSFTFLIIGAVIMHNILYNLTKDVSELLGLLAIGSSIVYFVIMHRFNKALNRVAISSIGVAVIVAALMGLAPFFAVIMMFMLLGIATSLKNKYIETHL